MTQSPSKQTSGNMATVRPTFHHTTLKTLKLQEMIDWYGLVVGMQAQHQFAGGAWLTNDEANHRIALLMTPGLKEDPEKYAHTGIHHTAFEYGSMGDLLDTYVRLKAQGILPHACLDHGITSSFYYEDPDGNSIELQVDNFGDWAQSGEWIRSSPQFAANPIGTPVDPAQMVAARAAGATFTEIHQRAYAGEFEPDDYDLHLPL